MRPLADRLRHHAEVERDGVVERAWMLPVAGTPAFAVQVRPAGRPIRQTGLVVCHSFFELKMFQGVELQLLRAAARRGFAGTVVHAPGMGDSLGDPTACLVADRLAAIAAGAAALRQDLTEVYGIGFVGARFGGALALLAAAEDPEPAGVALWDPVLEGDEYWRQLRRFERVVGALRRRRTDDPDTELAREGVTGTVGFAVTQAQRDDLRSIDRVHDQGRLEVPGLLLTLNDAMLRTARRQVEPLVSDLTARSLSRPRAKHLINLRIADAAGSIAPTVAWLDEALP